MNHIQNSTPGPHAAGVPHWAIGTEKVGVSKITLRQRHAPTMAVVGSFVAAEKLLRAWAADVGAGFDCDFTIHYLDGYQLCGAFPVSGRGNARQSLGDYVRLTLQPPDVLPPRRRARAPDAGGLRFGRNDMPCPTPTEASQQSFLAGYDVSDD
jgi:hypothetical protein